MKTNNTKRVIEALKIAINGARIENSFNTNDLIDGSLEPMIYAESVKHLLEHLQEVIDLL